MTNNHPKDDIEAVVMFLGGILGKLDDFSRQIDFQCNVLIGISSAIFLFSASRYQIGQGLFLLAIAFFSGLSAIISLFAMHPPNFMRKRGQKESLMYNKRIASFDSHLDYARELEKVIETKDVLIDQYALEIFNLSRHYYRPKRKLFNLARNVLMVGLAAGLLLFISGL